MLTFRIHYVWVCCNREKTPYVQINVIHVVLNYLQCAITGSFSDIFYSNPMKGYTKEWNV